MPNLCIFEFFTNCQHRIFSFSWIVFVTQEHASLHSPFSRKKKEHIYTDCSCRTLTADLPADDQHRTIWPHALSLSPVRGESSCSPKIRLMFIPWSTGTSMDELWILVSTHTNVSLAHSFSTEGPKNVNSLNTLFCHDIWTKVYFRMRNIQKIIKYLFVVVPHVNNVTERLFFFTYIKQNLPVEAYNATYFFTCTFD